MYRQLWHRGTKYDSVTDYELDPELEEMKYLFNFYYNFFALVSR